MGRLFALICLELKVANNDIDSGNDDRYLLNTYHGPCTIQMFYMHQLVYF